VEIALAAIALLDAREAGDESEAEIAPAFLPQDRQARPVRPSGGPPWRSPGQGPAAPPWRGPGQGPQAAPWAPRPPRPGIAPGGGWVRLFVGGGRRAGMRPGDLVGAITAEAGVPGSAIGAIQITDSFSLVDVADEVVEQVVRALRSATIRGRTLAVRLDREVR